jgi:hypothetical protein
LNDYQRFILQGNITPLRAEEVLNDPDKSGGLDAVGIYDLVLAAFGDEDLASQAGSRRAQNRQRDGLVP